MNKPDIHENNKELEITWADRDTSYDNLHDKTEHGNLDYPISVNYLDLRKTYMHAVRWHWHEEMEILIVNDGFAEVTTDDDTCVIEPGQGIIINQNVMHRIQSHDKGYCTFYSFVFHPDFLFGYKSNYLQTQFLLPIQSLRLFKTLVLNKGNEWHENMLDAINDAIAVNVTKPFGYEIATKGYLCRFWFLLLGGLPQLKTVVPDPHSSLDEQRVKQAMLFIKAHHAESLSLDDIAASVHISKSECCRCFSRTLQMTPFEYLMKYRIFEATKQMLEKPHEAISIADLASSVGFNNTSYFNKIFKKFLGCTPTYYRSHHVLSRERKMNGAFNIPLP